MAASALSTANSLTTVGTDTTVTVIGGGFCRLGA